MERSQAKRWAPSWPFDLTVNQLLKKIPFVIGTLDSARKFRKACNRYIGPYRLRRAMTTSAPRNIVIGSARVRYAAQWIPTDREFLDLTKPADWSRFFSPDSIDAMLAEHVWEHLTPEGAQTAARICFTYLKPGGYLRIAVPDGLHPSPTYREWVRVGGASPGQIANDHKVLYTHGTARKLFEDAGFRVELYEFFDEAGKFHFREWDEKAGPIRRSKRFDPRNRRGDLVFTSIVLDAIKH